MAANLTTKLGQLVDVLTPDTTNTRIGVANASPTRTLDVTGTFGASGASTLGGALTYGGITLSNAVTGTGNMMLSASPTLTGTLTAAIANFSGAQTNTVAGVPYQWTGNGAAVYPSFTGGGAVEYNFSNGSAEVDFWNTANSPTQSFAWRQQTGASSNTTLMTLFPAGNLSIGTTGTEGFFTVVKASPTNGRIAVFSNGVDANVIFPLSTSLSGIGSGTTTPFLFYTDGTERARIGSNGTFAIGTSDTTTYAVPLVIYKGSGTTFVSGGTGGQGIAFFMNIANANGYNAAQACAVGGGYSTVTSRSANFGGTVNASGADYAEYMTKADGCGVITKGSICGVDVTGELTDKFSNAHSFVIKSTNPSYIGGDTWGSVEILGDHPSLRGRSGNETDAAYRTRVTDFETKADAARQKVDRIAFSGQVPVNVIGATVGDYIVPVADPDGGITGETVTNPTFDQYRAAVGRVWKILEDGRAFVSVKVS
jgi:hypothetical protein